MKSPKAFAIILLFAASALSVAEIKDPVQVQGGKIAGAEGTVAGVRVYKGIPFAAPPVGDLRWREPQPVVPWTGVKQATEFSSMCVQEPRVRESLYWKRDEPISEDCLYLNVWTPAKAPTEKLPVMVWIYGGGLTQGSGSAPVFDGDHLAQRGVVFVTLNYRLGAFGFLAHPDLTRESPHHASGDYGLLDQNAALRWVHDNIAAFGGDPAKITIFGQSAGGMSVADQVASPLSKGLFIRAIGQSGGISDNIRSREDAEQSGIAFAKAVNASGIAELRSKTTEEIMQTKGRFGADVDGYFLQQTPYAIFAEGKQNNVAMMGGANADEGSTLRMALPSPSTPEDKAMQAKLYPPGMEAEATSDNFYWMMRTWGNFEAKTSRKPYLYLFTKSSPFPPGVMYMEGEGSKMHAYHGAELVFVFDNLQIRKLPWTATDRKLADTMATYWTNFAKTGDPNGKGLPVWPTYDPEGQKILNFGETVHEDKVPRKEALDYLDRKNMPKGN